MNNKKDNYLDSLDKGDIIEFEGDYYEFIRFQDDIIICDNLETIKINDMYNDLEFGINNKFLEFLKNEEEDKETDKGLQYNK